MVSAFLTAKKFLSPLRKLIQSTFFKSFKSRTHLEDFELKQSIFSRNSIDFSTVGAESSPVQFSSDVRNKGKCCKK